MCGSSCFLKRQQAGAVCVVTRTATPRLTSDGRAGNPCCAGTALIRSAERDLVRPPLTHPTVRDLIRAYPHRDLLFALLPHSPHNHRRLALAHESPDEHRQPTSTAAARTSAYPPLVSRQPVRLRTTARHVSRYRSEHRFLRFLGFWSCVCVGVLRGPISRGRGGREDGSRREARFFGKLGRLIVDAFLYTGLS